MGKPKILGTTRNHDKPAQVEARIRLGITLDQLKGVAAITPILKMATGGAKACIESLRGDDAPDAAIFLDKWDSLSPTDQKLLSIEEVCVAAGLTTRRLLEVITGAIMTQGDFAGKIIVASAKPDVIKRMVKEAKTALGEKDRENFLRGKDVDWFVPAKGLTVNLDNSKTQNILNAGSDNRALPPPKADDFLLELSNTIRPEALPASIAPEPVVTAHVPDVLDVEYADV